MCIASAQDVAATEDERARRARDGRARNGRARNGRARDVGGCDVGSRAVAAPMPSRRALPQTWRRPCRTTPADGPGGELDPSARPRVPPFGSRGSGAPERADGHAPRRTARRRSIPSSRSSLSFFASLGAVMPSSYDDAIQLARLRRRARPPIADGRIHHVRASRAGSTSAGSARRARPRLAPPRRRLRDGLGHRRDRRSPTGTPAPRARSSTSASTLGGGVGIDLASRCTTTTLARRRATRLHGAASSSASGIARGFHLFIRGAWDYFPWNDFDRFGSDIDLGGPMVGLGLEVKT
jgi:hypothetical protein